MATYTGLTGQGTIGGASEAMGRPMNFVLALSFREGNNTAPTLPGTYGVQPQNGGNGTTSITFSGTTFSARISMLRADAATKAVNATHTSATGVAGVKVVADTTGGIGNGPKTVTWNFDQRETTGRGQVSGTTSNSSNTPSAGALTITAEPDCVQHVVQLYCHESSDGTYSNAPTGMTNLAAATNNANAQAVNQTTSAQTSNWASANAAPGGTADGWQATTVLVKEHPFEVLWDRFTRLTALSADTWTSPSVSVTSGRVLVAIMLSDMDVAGQGSVTDSQGNTWTVRATVQSTNTNYRSRITILTATASSTGSMTITPDANASGTADGTANWYCALIQLPAGWDYKQSITDFGNTGFTSGARHYDLPAAAGATSLKMGLGSFDNTASSAATLTAHTGWSIYGFMRSSTAGDDGAHVISYKVNDATDDIEVGTLAQNGSFTFAFMGVEFGPASSSYSMAADAGAWTWTGATAGTLLGREVVADAGAWAWNGQDATLALGKKVVADPGAWTWTGAAAGLLATRKVDAAAGSWAWNGAAAGTYLGKFVTADAGSWSWNGQPVNLLLTRKVDAAAGSWVWTGAAAGLLTARKVDAAAGSWAWSGADAQLVYVPVGAYVLGALPGAWAWTGSDAGLLYSKLVVAAAGAWNWTGTAAGLLLKRSVGASAGAWVWTGADATLLLSSAPPATGGARDTDSIPGRPPGRHRGPRRVYYVTQDDEERIAAKAARVAQRKGEARKKRKKIARIIAEDIAQALGGLFQTQEEAISAMLLGLPELQLDPSIVNAEWTMLRDRYLSAIQSAEAEALRLRQEIEDEDTLLLLMAG